MAGGELKCNVLFFAAAAEAAGCRETELVVPSGSTVSDAFDLLASKHEQLIQLCALCAVAIDQQICSKDTQLTDGCTLAFLPPVSGG